MLPPDSAVLPPYTAAFSRMDGVQAVGMRGERRGQAAAAAADDKEVDLVIPGFKSAAGMDSGNHTGCRCRGGNSRTAGRSASGVPFAPYR